jgi:hypothetical protein
MLPKLERSCVRNRREQEAGSQTGVVRTRAICTGRFTLPLAVEDARCYRRFSAGGAGQKATVEQPRLTQARIAQNQSRFREANEQIENAADRYGLLLDTKIPFICECADASCHEIIRISFKDYENVRADSRTFINAPGHEAASGAASRVVAERDGYNIVRKRSHAGDVAAALDERQKEGEEAAS